MTRQELLAALLAERYGTPVRQVSGADGPTARWARRTAVEEAWAGRRPYRPHWRAVDDATGDEP